MSDFYAEEHADWIEEEIAPELETLRDEMSNGVSILESILTDLDEQVDEQLDNFRGYVGDVHGIRSRLMAAAGNLRLDADDEANRLRELEEVAEELAPAAIARELQHEIDGRRLAGEDADRVLDYVQRALREFRLAADDLTDSRLTARTLLAEAVRA